MKKENYYKILYVISAMSLLGFVIRLGADYYKYDYITIPFYIDILIRALEFILPGLLIFIAGIICKKKYTKNIENKNNYTKK